MSDYALVTGASGGLGVDFADLLAADGYNLILVARSADKLRAVAQTMRERHHIEVEIYVADLSDAAVVNRMIDFIEEKGWKVTCLINNAGFGSTGYFTENEWDGYERMMNLNMTTLARLSHHFGGKMADYGKGKILNISSNGAFQPAPNMAVYAASKAFVLHFSEALRFELRSKGVHVTCSCPGPTATDFHNVAGTNGSLIIRLGLLDSRRVANEALRALKKNRQFVVHGWTNKLFVLCLRFIPRTWIPPMAYHFIK